MRPTKEGMKFLIATSLIAVAAVNTGNNLIYLILALMLSLTLISFVLMRINLSGLSLRVTAAAPLFAGEQSPVVITVQNNRRRFPAYSVSVLTPDSGPVFFGLIPAGTAENREHIISFKRRGFCSYGEFTLESSFPFSLFSRRKTASITGSALVYPALMDVDAIIPAVHAHGGGPAARTALHGDELYSLRDFRHGDDWRQIHWKSSAKASGLLVKEYASEEFRKATIIIDNVLPSETETFEAAVSLAASLSKYLLDDGYIVRLFSCKKIVPFGLGDEQLFRILDVLAVIREEQEWECPASHDREGFSVLVLKNRRSPLSRYVSSSDLVIYAADL